MYKQNTTFKNAKQTALKTALNLIEVRTKSFIKALENLDLNRPNSILRAERAESALILAHSIAHEINPFYLALKDVSDHKGEFSPRDETGLLLCFNEENKRFRGE